MKFLSEYITFRLLGLVLLFNVCNCIVWSSYQPLQPVTKNISCFNNEDIDSIIFIENDFTEQGLNVSSVSTELKEVSVKCLYNYINSYAFQFHPEITPPPPKA